MDHVWNAMHKHVTTRNRSNLLEGAMYLDLPSKKVRVFQTHRDLPPPRSATTTTNGNRGVTAEGPNILGVVPTCDPQQDHHASTESTTQMAPIRASETKVGPTLVTDLQQISDPRTDGDHQTTVVAQQMSQVVVAPPKVFFRVVCIADTHDKHRCIVVPPGDILIHAGDIQMCARRFSDGDCLAKIQDFNAWLGELPHKVKVVIGGNHDAFLHKVGVARARELLSNASYLCNEEMSIPHPEHPFVQLHLFASPFSTGSSGNKAFQRRGTNVPAELKNVFPVEIVPVVNQLCAATVPVPNSEEEEVTTSDAAVSSPTGSSSGVHQRKKVLLDVFPPSTSRKTPLYDLFISHEPQMTHIRAPLPMTKLPTTALLTGHVHIGGHLHTSYGVEESQQGTVAITACSLDGKYCPANPPIVFDYAPQPTIKSAFLQLKQQ